MGSPARARASDSSVSHRLHPHTEMQALAGVDGKSAVAFVVHLDDSSSDTVARWASPRRTRRGRLRRPRRMAWSRRWNLAVPRARRSRAPRRRDEIEAFVMTSNEAMLHVLHKNQLGAKTVGVENGVYHLVLPLVSPPAEGELALPR